MITEAMQATQLSPITHVKDGKAKEYENVYRKSRLNKRGDWRRQTEEMKCGTEQTMKLE